MDDQTIRLNLQSNVPEEMARARAAAGELNGTLNQAGRDTLELAGNYTVLTTRLSETDAAFDRQLEAALETTRAQKVMAQTVEEVGGVTRTHVTTTDAASRATGEFNRNMLTLGQSVQDFGAAGFLGISNNLDRLVMMIGGPAGMAAGVMIAGAAFLAFEPQVKEAAKALGLFGDDAGASKDRLVLLKEQVEALEKKEFKLAVDIRQLEGAREEVERIERSLKAVDALREQRAPVVSEAGKRVTGILDSAIGGGDELATRLVEASAARQAAETPRFAQIEQERGRISPELERIKKDVAGGESDPAVIMRGGELQTRLDQLNEEKAALERTNMQRANTEVGSALTGAKKGDARGRDDLAGQLRGIGEEELAERILDATPGAIIGERLEKTWDAFARKAVEAAHKQGEKMTPEKVYKEGEAIWAEYGLTKKEEAAQARKEQADGEAIQRGMEGVDRDAVRALEKKRQAALKEIRAADDAQARAIEHAQKQAEQQAGRRLTSQQGAEQDLARGIQSQYGGTEGQALGVARESLHLQRQGLDAGTATQTAVAEMAAVLHGNVREFQQLRHQAEMLVMQVRQIQSEMGQRPRSNLRRGGYGG